MERKVPIKNKIKEEILITNRIYEYYLQLSNKKEDENFMRE